MTPPVKRLVTVPTIDLTIGDLEEFTRTARIDGADELTPVRLIETAPFIKAYRLQAICPPNAPKKVSR